MRQPSMSEEARLAHSKLPAWCIARSTTPPPTHLTHPDVHVHLHALPQPSPPHAPPVDKPPLLRQAGGLRGAEQPLAIHKVLELVVSLRQAAAQRVLPARGIRRQRQQLRPAVEGTREQHILPAQLPAAPGEDSSGLDEPARGEEKARPGVAPGCSRGKAGHVERLDVGQHLLARGGLPYPAVTRELTPPCPLHCPPCAWLFSSNPSARESTCTASTTPPAVCPAPPATLKPCPPAPARPAPQPACGC